LAKADAKSSVELRLGKPNVAKAVAPER
jgi:hypothetical protein